MKRLGYFLVTLFCTTHTYIKDVMVLQKEQQTIIFLCDYHWDDKEIADAQEPFFRKFFSQLPTDALVHLETTPGPHNNKKIATYTKNNKDESCATIFHLQQALFAGKKHQYSFTKKSFEVRTKDDTKYGVQIPYRMAFGKNKPSKETVKEVHKWIKDTIHKTNYMLKNPGFVRLFDKQDIKAVVKKLSQHLKSVKLPQQAQEVYKISSVQVDITLLHHLLESENKIQVVIGGRDHLRVVAEILQEFKDYKKVYSEKGDDTSVWGQKLLTYI